MASHNQCVISLSKLTLPESVNLKKLTLSVVTSSEQIYIQNNKNVRTNKINFYRQNIFLTTFPQHLSFKLYAVNDFSDKVLIKQLKTLKSDLIQIKPRPTAFKTSDQDFSLDWEGWIFTEDSEDLNDYTQRDYSQLDCSFQNEEESNGSQILKDANLNKQKATMKNETLKKRSSSTDGSSSPDPKKQSDHVANGFNLRRKVVENKIKSPSKQRNTIKSHIYCQLVKIASDLFSKSNQ